MDFRGFFGGGRDGSNTTENSSKGIEDKGTGRLPRGHDDYDFQASSPTYEPPSYSGESHGAYENGIGGYQGDWADHRRNKSTALADVNDPVAMHLLLETACEDSRGFELLSYGEVEALKEERTHLLSRIEGVKQKLALESKMRDAAQSINRLYSKPNSEASETKRRSYRRSLTGIRSSSGSGNIKADAVGKSQDELEVSARLCEDLSRELRQLEFRATEVQELLLKHTAGVLQLTLDKASGEKHNPHSLQPNGAGPGTSFFNRDPFNAYDGGRVDDGFDAFDHRSLYRLAENLDGLTDYPTSTNSGVGKGNTRLGMESLEPINGRLDQVNKRLRELILQEGPRYGQDYPSAPGVEKDASDQDQLSLIERQIGYLDQGLEDFNAIKAAASIDLEGKLEEYSAAVSSIWDAMISNEEEIRRRKQERKQILAANPELEEFEYDSTDEDPPAPQSFSLTAFSAKVQAIHRRANNLAEQHSILKRQIEQQRKLSGASNAEKDAQVATLNAQLERYSEDLSAREERIIELESDFAAAKDDARIAAVEAAEAVRSAKQAGEVSQAQARAQVQSLEEQLASKEEELRRLEGDVVRLQTDVTVARAELDAAYGSRAERAAQVAADPAVQQQLAEASKWRTEKEQAVAQVAELKTELQDLLAELEELAKASVDAEREREGLETVVDGLRDRCEALESQLAEERIRSLGSKGSPNGIGDGTPHLDQERTSTTVLKNEFKKLMREARAESLKTLRAEQEERRRLEALVRSLRREQSSVKSRANGAKS